ncbi:alpha/beta fold hydrolase [Nonomuraea turkmeniaca]|uniref:Alpha/beta fold hydrolase n=1 Tax=Nonomuraea turkmeniaca TaxID=103838 RepID=A0A5S4EVH2_9ACTN|nr:alpha/beta fold hydrolase [Nonomuraea turkmeniaca]TMR06706.1 alpha/beta fold hydrolase [Nonomuraea turkmeniaca]
MERRLYVLAASALIVAAVLGSAWITGQFTTPGVDKTHGYVTELAARDQPWTHLFRVSDALSGLACLLGVALVPRVEREWPGWLALAAYALFTIVAAVLPLDCAALSDPACGRQGLSIAHHAHLLAGALATGGGVTAMALLATRWRTRTAWLLAWLTLAATALTAAALAAGRGAGLAHRAQLTLIAVWLVYAALRLLVTDRQPPGHGTPHVVEEGDGPAVLITAGPAGAWFHWDAVAGHLAGTRRVIRFDRPGLGLSPRSPAPPTLYAEVARLAALAPAHPEQVTVVAHGVSCWHAEAFARLHPLCVAKLVFVDPVCPDGRRPQAAARAAGRWLPALGGTWGATAVARLAGPAAHRRLAGVPDPLGVYRMGKVPAAVAGEWLARRDMAADLHRIREDKPFPDVPVTVLYADGRAGCAERLAGDLGAELVYLPRAGRRLHLHAPRAIVDAI